MAEVNRKYKGSLTLGKLEIALEAHEALFGDVKSLEVVGNFTVATFNDDDFPATSSLALLPCIDGAAPPAPEGATLLFSGEVSVLGQNLKVAAFRTS